MEPPAVKHGFLRNILVRIFSFAVLVFAARFAIIVTVHGGSCDSSDFCFFSDNLNLTTRAQISSTGDPFSGKNWRRSVEYYAGVFQDLIAEGSLSPNSRALCIDTPTGEDVLALKEVGVVDSVGIFKKPSPPLIVKGEGRRQPFSGDAFEFEFSGNGGLERSPRPAEFAAEVSRTLRPGGFLAVHTAARDAYSFNSFLELFNCCELIRTREINGVDSSPVLEILMKKKMPEFQTSDSSSNGNSVNKCSIPGYKREIVKNAEALIVEEPLKPWITLKRNLKNIKYLTSLVDISFKNRYVYVDVGARSYGSSIGSWFRKQYPKQNRTFEVYAIEADKAFHEEYRTKKGITFLPYAAWVRNETLFFEITRDPSKKVMMKGRGMGRINPVQTSSSHMGDMDKIQGFDFANWLKSVVTSRDFVVVKMDVEGTEFHLIPRLIQTGAICLIDELFLECHYNRWQRCCPGQRSAKYQKTYSECLDLFASLRNIGVLVHQWW
ncbi:S-adenosyl-L-methionine-dependent methyltransferase [Sesbania bispinosa]|nr:S-adenosyl-L-methionine-dependent methyltransferase [Sesbania bispinosa]